MTTHTCPDCGASHRIKAAKKPPRTPRADTCTDLNVTKCRRCAQPVLAGRIGGFDRHLDPGPLNEIGWRAYRGIGREIYIRSGIRADITSAMHRWPPAERCTLYVAHQCDNPVPRALIGNRVTDRQRTIEFPKNPPY